MVWLAPERHLCARVMGVVANTRKEPSDMQVTTRAPQSVRSDGLISGHR
jgi:hypothetical protein